MSGRIVSAIVLAGGRSTRFGRNKLAEPVEGKPLLDHAVDGVRSFAGDIIVVVAPDDPPPVPRDGRDVRIVRDAVAHEGPLAGLVAGLGAAYARTVFVTAGDMPALQPTVAVFLLDVLVVVGADAVVLEAEGRPRQLPMALARDPARKAAQRLFASGERRLGALLGEIATEVIPEVDWRPFDPEGRSLRDVDTPDDLP